MNVGRADLPQLWVLRHAKAESGGRDRDHSRTITDRGQRQGTAVGRWLAAKELVPDTVWCSSATRARQTWEVVAAELPSPPEPVLLDALYDAGVQDALDLLHEAPDTARRLILVGHNPTMEELVSHLTGKPVELGTGVLAMLGGGQPWPALAGATLLELVDPREL